MNSTRHWSRLSLGCALVSLLLQLILGNKDVVGIALSLFLVVLALWMVFSPPTASRAERQLVRLRQQGVYPPPGQGTDEDVRRVLRASHRLFAVKLYIEIHGVTLKEAVEAVKRMN